ncbi:MAG: hypothetical protein M1823_000300 [Watsoniomyces obsoletus]|nr:MAG: hypothetical protein M1823_000300 [Watsoniomyces obsoletus]
MSNPLINATIQAALLSATSNILAQILTAYRTDKNDAALPSANGDEKQEKTEKLNVRNTLIKVFLDQSLGAAVNTVAFIATMGSLRGQSRVEVFEAVARDFWPVTKAGLKVWPLVSALNFTVVPLHNRIVVASLVGVGWGVYLSLVAAST